MNGKEDDFKGKYSKEVYIEVPIDYEIRGCKIYGCAWFDESMYQNKDVHLYRNNGKLIKNDIGYSICVGTPESFLNMKNVILEAVHTAENILIAYERYQSGQSKDVELGAYSHGEKGREEYKKDNKRYIPR